MGAALAEPTRAATHTWDGGDVLFTFWGTANNWNPNATPAAGDALVFPSGLAVGDRATSNTFVPGMSFASLLFQDVGYTVAGNAITITDFVEMNAGTGTTTVSPAITLGAATIDFRCAGTRSTLTFEGGISLAGHTLQIEANPGQIEFLGGVSDSGSGQLIKTGAGSAFFATGTTVTATGGTQINAGRVVMDGSATHLVSVASGATLAGVGSASTATISGTLAPGGTSFPAYGTFTSGSALTMTGTSTLEMQLANPPGTSDQVAATGTVSIQSGATLSITLPSPLRLGLGNAFTLIQKTSSGAISGTFSNAPQGGTLVVGRVTFLVDYTGGTGNDLVLTVSEVAPSGVTRSWDGGGSNDLWTTAQNWNGDVAPESGDSISFPTGAARLFPINDFTADFPLADVTIASGTYSFSGNRFGWIGDMFLTHTDADLVFNIPLLIAPIGFSGKGNLHLTGSKKFTLNGDLEDAPNAVLVVRNLATGGGGFRFSGAASLDQTIVVLANSSSTPIDWGPDAASSCQLICTLGESIRFTGPGVTLAQVFFHGKTPPFFGYTFGVYPPADLTIHSGALLQTFTMNLSAGSKIHSAPGATASLLVDSTFLFDGDATFTTGAGGSFTVIAAELTTGNDDILNLDADFICNNGFEATVGTNSVCTLRSLTGFSSGYGFRVAGGGRLRVGPVNNLIISKVIENSTLEFTSAAAGLATLDIELGEAGPIPTSGHLAGTGSCGTVLPLFSTCTVSPGSATAPYGILTCKALASAISALRFDVGGLVPGVSQDQVRITQQISYSGGFMPVIQFVGGYAPQPGQEIVLVEHAPGTSISGTSTPGSVFVYGQRFFIYTSGGDGNDFAFLKQTVAAPTTGAAAGLPGPSLQFQSGQWHFGQPFKGIMGVTYVVEKSTNLTNWTEAQRIETSSFQPGSPIVYTNIGFSLPVDLVQHKKQFFRVRPL